MMVGSFGVAAVDAPMMQSTSDMLAAYRQQRHEVRERHRTWLDDLHTGASDAKPATQTFTARTHPRWAELMGSEAKDKDKEQASQSKVNAADAANAANTTLLGPAFIPSESTVRNDYSQRFVDTGIGLLPSNAVRNPSKQTRFAEYPKLRRLIEAKASLLDVTSIPPTYLEADLLESIAGMTDVAGGRTTDANYAPPAFHLANLLPIKYDAVMIDPPLEAYEWESTPCGGAEAKRAWSWDQLAALPIPQIVAKESFIFLWVGSGAGDGLERGREVLMRWGYRRCEDIVWIRTNDVQGRDHNESVQQPTTSSTFTRTAQHCLMGIRGTVRRSLDTRFVHCNIDTDVILWPGETAQGVAGSADIGTIDERSKPPEMMDLIENFCLGTRRLELFGRNRNLRRGWLTVGLEVGPDHAGWQEAVDGRNACVANTANADGPLNCQEPIAYDKLMYDAAFGVDRVGCSLAERSNLVPFNAEIDDLRPRSPRPDAAGRKGAPYARLPGRNVSGTGGHFSTFDVQVQSAAAGASAYMDPANSFSNPHFDHQQRAAFAPSYVPMHPHAFTMQQQHHQRIPAGMPGGAGLSGLGAGGRAVVSVPSGSEMLSGAQASVLLGQAHAQRVTHTGGIQSVSIDPETCDNVQRSQ